MTPKNNLRVAIIGVGQMGRHHVRVYSQIRGVDLIGVVDPNEKHARDAANTFGCPSFNTIDPILEHVDAVSIATPPATHAAIGTKLLNRGIHCLIEKPLATTEDHCQQLIQAAQKNNAILLVGHIERFNPAVQTLAAILSQGCRIHAIDIRRMSRASARITDVDVIADLMTHDLDIVMSLIQEPIRQIVASSVQTADSPGSDYVTALLSFSGGAMASLTASRITQNKIRELNITADLGWITVDLIRQELCIFHQGGGHQRGIPGPHYGLDYAIERVTVKHAEPLAVEIQHFVDAVRGHTAPLTTGQHALAVLKATQIIREKTRPPKQDT
ncbi:MAG: Gfo/Idh/MocA family oxidoreductase [Nitrospirae bacterium]|nr:Gfo/Idh/MocA family oxidoreductase [Magnetococcales bacterium]